MTNNTIYNNSGNGVYTKFSTNSFVNNIFWNNKIGTDTNTSGTDYLNQGSTNTFKNNLLQLLSTQYTSGSGYSNALATGSSDNIFNTNPNFVNKTNIVGADGKHRTADDGLQLRCSAALNTGLSVSTTNSVPATDILGNPIYDSKDMGAYEKQAQPYIPTLYVNASVSGGTGDGTSWVNAFASLDDALALAHCGSINTIKVAAGSYKPTKKPYFNGTEMTTADDRDVTFHIPNAVRIEGGYNGTSGIRDIVANITILSGDIGVENIAEDNAYHVVLSLASSVSIDGFSITNGGSTFPFNTSTLLVNGINVRRNSGGGIFIYGGTSTLTNNTLYDNSADLGGGISIYGGTNILSNNILYNNSNESATSGGGIYSFNGDNKFTNNTLYGNSASSGGGIYTFNGINILTNNTFYNNSARFTENNYAVPISGGGIYFYSGTNTLTNNIFWNNKRGTNDVTGADFYAFQNTANTFKNNLLQLASSTYGNNLGANASGNIFIQNPNFVSTTNIVGADGKHRTADDGLQLDGCSPAINTGLASSGTPNIIPATDILDKVIYNNLKDMGAYERQLPKSSLNTIHVNALVSGGTGDGSSWVNAYASLANALAAAHTCSVIKTIRVAAGTYKPTKKPFNGGVEMTTDTDNKDMTFHIPDGVTIEGGYNGISGTRDIVTNITILSGDIGLENVTNDNSNHVVLAVGPVGIKIDGFYITQGRSSYGTISLNGKNIYRGSGGGIYTIDGTNTLTNNTLYNNSAGEGGGINIDSGTNTLTNNILYNNSVDSNGGGIYTNAGTNTLTNNILYNNSSFRGGGIYTNDGTNTLMNNTLYNNSAIFYGGGIWTKGGMNSRFMNNIFWGNTGGSADGTGVDYITTSNSSNTFKNNLLQLGANSYSSSNISGNNDLGANASDNIFTKNPLFLNASNPAGVDGIYRTADDGLQLLFCSPAKNTGLASLGAPNIVPASDILGNTIYNSFKDIGAYERQSSSATFVTVINNCGSSILSAPTDMASYLWSNGAAIKDIIVLNSGVYTVVVTSASGCQESASATAAPKAIPTVNIAVTNNCGSSILTATNGASAYLWSNGATTASTTVSNSGVYTVTVTYSAGCTATANATAAPKAVPTVNITVTNNCSNSVLSAATTPPLGLAYLWSNAATTANTTVSNSGVYTITVTGTNGCTTAANATAVLKIVPTVNIAVTNNCGSAVLTASATPTGGAYLWSNGATISNINVSSTLTTTYTVTATGTNGCTATNSVEIQGIVLYVNRAIVGGSGDGSSWPNAYASLSEALAKAHTCSSIKIIRVAAGTYKPSKKPFNSGTEMTTTDNRDMTFHIPNGVTIEGGYNVNTGARDITGNVTTLSGDFIGDDVTTGTGATLSITNNTENAYHVVLAVAASSGATGVTVDGFTIAGGNANGNGILKSCGGGFYTDGESKLTNCILTRNSASFSGGAIRYTSGTHTAFNNIFNSNICDTYASVIGTITTSYSLYNNTFVNNKATSIGTVIYNYISVCVAKNNIYFGNTKGADMNIATADVINDGGTVTMEHSLLQGGSAYSSGTGNIVNINPLFINEANSDFNLQANSPCINTGTTTGAPAIDILGVARPQGSGVDMGAYELSCAGLTATIAVTNNCGNALLNLTTSASGGTKTFLWSNGATTEDITVSVSNTYNVTVTNANGCTATTSATAVPKGVPYAYNVTGSGLQCAGGAFVSLDGSQYGVSYQLKKAGIDMGTSQLGNGYPLYFGDQIVAGVYTVVATNAEGCTAVMVGSATVTIDATLPAFVTASVPANVTINCNAAIPTAVTPTVTNSCSTISLATTSTKGTDATQCNFYSYTITRTWTATDKRNNSTTVSQVITVQDNVAPTIAPLSNITVTEGTIPKTIANVDCMASPTVTFTETKVTHTPPPCKNYSYTLTRTWRVTDACGNSSTATQTIKAEGIKLTCPSDKTIYTNSDGLTNYNCSSLATAAMNLSPIAATINSTCNSPVAHYAITGATTATGNGSVAGVTFAKGVSTITYKLISNVSDQCSLNLTVLDNEGPKITLIPTVVLDACIMPNPIPDTYKPTMSDNCTGTNTLEVMNDVLADQTGCATKVTAQKYTKLLTRTWKATDENSNTTTAVQRIFLRDMAPPITVCKNVTVNIGSANITLPVSSLNNGSNDNCTAANALTFVGCQNTTTACTNFGANLTLKASMIPAGQNQTTITVRVKARDACGNETATPVSVIITLKRIGTMNNTTNGSENSMAIQDTESSIPAEASTVPTVHGEMKCYPTPFSEDLNIQYNLTEKIENVTLKLYDTQGRLVTKMEQESQATGFYQVRWNLSDLQAGMYHVCLELNGKCTKMERVIMMK